MGKTVILDGARTPFGKFGGTLSGLTASQLGGIAIKEAITRSGIKAEEIDGISTVLNEEFDKLLELED